MYGTLRLKVVNMQSDGQGGRKAVDPSICQSVADAMFATYFATYWTGLDVRISLLSVRLWGDGLHCIASHLISSHLITSTRSKRLEGMPTKPLPFPRSGTGWPSAVGGMDEKEKKEVNTYR